MPHLLPVLVRLPERDAVLLGHVAALGEEFLVGDCLLALVAALLHEQLGGELLLRVLLRLQPHLALLVGHHLALGLRHVDTHVLLLGLALADTWRHNYSKEREKRMTDFIQIFSDEISTRRYIFLPVESDMTLLGILEDPLEVEILRDVDTELLPFLVRVLVLGPASLLLLLLLA